MLARKADNPLNPIRLALSYDASFVARGYAGDPNGLTKIIEAGVKHRGFSFIQILTPCVTFDKENTIWTKLKEKVYPVDLHEKENNRETDMAAAEHAPFGMEIFFRDKERPHYQDVLRRLNSRKTHHV